MQRKHTWKNRERRRHAKVRRITQRTLARDKRQFSRKRQCSSEKHKHKPLCVVSPDIWEE